MTKARKLNWRQKQKRRAKSRSGVQQMRRRKALSALVAVGEPQIEWWYDYAMKTAQSPVWNVKIVGI